MAGQIPLKKLSTKILFHCMMMLEYDDQSLSPAHRSVKGYGVKIIKQCFVSRCAFLLFIFFSLFLVSLHFLKLRLFNFILIFSFTFSDLVSF